MNQKELKKVLKKHNIKSWGETPDGIRWCICNGHTLKSKCPAFKEWYYQEFIRLNSPKVS